MINLEKAKWEVSILCLPFPGFAQHSPVDIRPLQNGKGEKPRNIIFILTDDHRNDFYDIQNNPDEMYNLIEKPELQPVIKEHLKDLNQWLERTDGLKIPLKTNYNYRNSDYRHQKQY